MFSRSASMYLDMAVGCAAAVAAFAAQAVQPSYSVIDLAGSNCDVRAINDRGVIVGSCNQTAVAWYAGVPTTLGRLVGGTYSTATAVNGAGLIIGEGDTGNFRPQAWVETASGPYNFFPNNGGNTHAVFVGDDGYIGGYYTKSLSGNTSSWRGAIWTPDPKDARKYRTTDLPILAGGDPKLSSSVPQAFNQAGQAAGWASNDIIGQHAAFWYNDASHTIQDLGTLPGDWSSIAWGLNDLGYAVGESHPPAGSRPVMWSNDAARTPMALPLLSGDNFGSAGIINNLGHVLGWSAYATPGTWNVGPARPVIWRDGGAFELQSVLDPVSGAGWTITSTVGLNNLGQIIGYGQHNGEVRSFVLTPLQ